MARRGSGSDGFGSDGWRDWEHAPPLAVEGGLTARSTRGAIGASWWSKRFIAVLESFGAGGRLTRGRAYARKGQVLSLDLVPGVVSGTVQGSRPAPYEVWITMPVLAPSVWAGVEAAIGEQALFAAQLLGGELPAELEDVVAAAGGALFPASFRDLSMQCTCPDWGLPCKHLAAAFYLLAETFDDDPFRILTWRGRTRAQLLAGITEATSPADAPPDGASPGGSADSGSPGDGSSPAGVQGAGGSGRGATAGPGRRRGAVAAAGTGGGTSPGTGGGTAPGAGGGTAPGAGGGTAPGAGGGTGAPVPVSATAALGELPATTATDALDRFWVSPVPLPPRPPALDAPGDLLLRQLPGPPASLGGAALATALNDAYHRLTTKPE